MNTLIKEVNDLLHQQQLNQQKMLTRLQENFNCVFPTEQQTFVIETAIDFLHKTITMIKNAEKLTPEQANVVASKLTSLELLADPGTRGATLSMISGNDSVKKLSTILKHTSDENTTSNPVDKVLVALSNKIGKSGVKNNLEFFSNLEAFNEKQRNERINQILTIIKQLEKLDFEIQKIQQKQQVTTPQPAVV